MVKINSIGLRCFRDFWHASSAPNKLKGNTKAVASRKIIAVLELNFSSLQENFIEHYANHPLDAADVKILFWMKKH